jgi:hypothetical protein
MLLCSSSTSICGYCSRVQWFRPWGIVGYMSSFVNLLYFETHYLNPGWIFTGLIPKVTHHMLILFWWWNSDKLWSVNLPQAIIYLTFPFILLTDGMSSNSTLEFHVSNCYKRTIQVHLFISFEIARKMLVLVFMCAVSKYSLIRIFHSFHPCNNPPHSQLL